MMATPNSTNDWNNCPSGEIAGLVSALKTQRRRETLQQAAGVSAVIMIFVVGATFWISGWFANGQPIPRIACGKVHDLAPRFVAGELDEDLSVRIDHHLERCNTCRRHFQTEFPRFPLPAHAARTGNAAPVVVAMSGR